jgi:hypothetical protein
MATSRNAKRYGGRPPVATPKPLFPFAFASYLFFINADAEHNRNAVNNFANKLLTAETASHVCYEMDWSDKFFAAAAQAEVAEFVVTLLSEGHSTVEVRAEMERKVSSDAASTRHSTSPTSNLMQGYRLERFAQFLRDHRSFGVPTKQMQLKALMDEVLA